MTTTTLAGAAHAPAPPPHATSDTPLLKRAGPFYAVLAVLLLALACSFPVAFRGDISEYTLTALAVADHGTPDLRPADIARGTALVPGRPEFALIDQSLRTPGALLYPTYARGRDGKAYSIHFFGYSALAALPVKALDALGLPPMKGFQLLNLAFVFVLGVAMFGLFGDALRALCGVALFMLCGGGLFWTWTSPECMSAAALLAGLLFYTGGRPLAGAVLAGLAAQQNPTVAAFFGFAPLLQLAAGYRPGAGLRASIAPLVQPRYLLALAAGVAVAGVPVAFNLYHYGVPNLIATQFSDAQLISLVRLESFFFDLNQGMIIGLPAVFAALLCWGWRAPDGTRRRAALLAAAGALFTLTLALPAMAVLNWNSDAAGLMRYAFWAAMPLLFVLLLRLSAAARWPRALVAGVLLVQALAMLNAASYNYVTFSPLALAVLRYAPTHYHPEPEIFAERSAHNDDYITRNKVYTYRVNGQRVTTLYNLAYPGIEEQLCGTQMNVSPHNTFIDGGGQWRYLHGEVLCVPASKDDLHIGAEQFRLQGAQLLASGWSAPEFSGGEWDGAWSEGGNSRIVVPLATSWRPTTLVLSGHYLDGVRRTRVTVNGVDLGWHALNEFDPIALPPAAVASATTTIDLRHEAPRSPGPADPRKLALFIQAVTLR